MTFTTRLSRHWKPPLLPPHSPLMPHLPLCSPLPGPSPFPHHYSISAAPPPFALFIPSYNSVLMLPLCFVVLLPQSAPLPTLVPPPFPFPYFITLTPFPLSPPAQHPHVSLLPHPVPLSLLCSITPPPPSHLHYMSFFNPTLHHSNSPHLPFP